MRIFTFYKRLIKLEKEIMNMANNQKNNRTNNLVVPSFAQAVNQMKQEIAQEFGVQLGPDTTARANGSVGGEITKRLVALAEQQLGGHKKEIILKR
jgi:hypothetical protein